MDHTPKKPIQYFLILAFVTKKRAMRDENLMARFFGVSFSFDRPHTQWICPAFLVYATPLVGDGEASLPGVAVGLVGKAV